MERPSNDRPEAGKREPNSKGAAFPPLVAALKNLPNWEDVVPTALRKYFEEPVLASGWYPESDYFTLLEALARALEAHAAGADVWHFLGVAAAQRDIGGCQDQLPEEVRVRQGLYQSFKSGGPEDIGTFVKRAIMLWDQYHDTGEVVIQGGRRTTNSIIVRLIGFVVPVDGYLRLHAAYTEEHARLVGIELYGAVTRSTARGDPFCEWKYTFVRTSASEAYVASLPELPAS